MTMTKIFRPDGLEFKKPEFSPFGPQEIVDVGLDTRSLLDTAQNIYLTLRRTWSDHDFSCLCDPDWDRITIYVDPVGIDVINEDFFKWMEFELSDESEPWKAPLFVSLAASNLLKAIYQTLKHHWFDRLGEGYLSPGGHFSSMGPFFDRSKISSYLEIAARNTGISLELLKRFRDAYPEELRCGMQGYFDTFDIGVCDW